MREIKTEIEISSSPKAVWNALMDFPEWPNWNPIVNKISGQNNVGAELQITMSDKNGNDSKAYTSTITALEPEQLFSFHAVMMANFLFSVERTIELKPSSAGTLLLQKETYNGLLVSLFWGKLSTEALSMLASMNQALKQKIEE